MGDEPDTQAQKQQTSEIEPDAILCLGGPRHGKSVAWRGEQWEFEGWTYSYCKLQLKQLVDGERIVTKVYVPIGVKA